MNNKSFLLLAWFGLFAISATINLGAQSYGNLGFSVRRHAEHSEFDELPFAKRDHSLGVSYEFHEELAFWQIGVRYTPDLSVKKNADPAAEQAKFAVTPELNLLIKDNIYQAGVGIASTYTDADDGEWTSLYWQFILGIGFDITRKVSLAAYGYYPFKRWGDISDFSTKDVEFGIRVGFRF